jgi:hypothetical protein
MPTSNSKPYGLRLARFGGRLCASPSWALDLTAISCEMNARGLLNEDGILPDRRASALSFEHPRCGFSFSSYRSIPAMRARNTLTGALAWSQPAHHAHSPELVQSKRNRMG